MGAREVIAKALAEYWDVPDQADGYELAAEDVEKALGTVGYVILSPDEVRAIRDKALEEAAKCGDAWDSPSSLRLAAGEMTAQELRTARAVARGIASAIRSLRAKEAQDATD